MRISDWSSDVCSSDLGVRGMSLKLRERVIEMLSSRPDERFTARAIASWICKNYRAEADEKLTVSKSLKSKTELLNQLVAATGANRPACQRKQIGRASCRERERQYVYISRVAGSLTTKTTDPAPEIDDYA